MPTSYLRSKYTTFVNTKYITFVNQFSSISYCALQSSHYQLIIFRYNFCIYECLIKFVLLNLYKMDTDNLIMIFERRLKLQKYSPNSIKNYCSAVKIFLRIAVKRFNHPDELNETEIEKYVFWKIEKDNISDSHQRMIVASIDKFYRLVLNRELKIKHLYPSRKRCALPRYITVSEVKKMIAYTPNRKHACIIKMIYGCGLRLTELLHLKLSDIDSERM